MTRRLYYEDSHRKEFDATVLSCRREGERYAVVLDQTVFFPEGGGQKSDTGLLNNLPVADVQIKEGEIVHYTESSLEAGSSVHGVIYWPERFAKMQAHSGEHIVSGVVFQKYGFDNAGFHMGADGMAVDFSGEIPPQELKEVERLANEAIWQNLKFSCYFPAADELCKLQYRSKLDLSEDVRIVEIEGLDRCACCAPHVNFAGEVGQLRILSSQRLRGGTRLLLLCGEAAYNDSLCKYDNVTQISNLLSTKPNEVASAVEKLQTELSLAREKARMLQEKLGNTMLASLPAAVQNPCFFAEFDPEPARALCNAAMEKYDGLCGVFTPADTGYRYIIASKTVDLRFFSKKINELLRGRGGGKPPMMQGSVSASREEIEAFFQSFRGEK